jgi:DHA1 family bicyclomycin/chloramphenicol resistance-like MFS transporter
LWLLVMVTFSGTLAMHMVVPALSRMADDLRVTPASAQSIISVYILGLAIGQLIYGPLSDRLGRRPTLLFGLTLFTAAAGVCMMATTLGGLAAARFLQAMGGCAGLLLGRAIVRDTSSDSETMRRLATMQLVTMVGPGFAPLIGGVVATHLGWRWIFGLFIAFGAAGLAATWRLMPETRRPPAQGTRQSLARDYARLLRSPAFLGCVVGGGCATTSFYAFMTAAPFLLGGRFGQPMSMIGVDLLVLIAGVSLGNLICTRWRRGVVRTLLLANRLSLAAATALILQLATGHVTAWSIVATMFIYCIGSGMCSPVVVSKAMSIEPSVTGSASGIYGFGQMLVGAACTTGVGLGRDAGLSAAIVLLVACGVAQASFMVVGHHSADGR